MDALAAFHPAVRAWFSRRFPEGPTAPQAEGWPAIASGVDTLIAAPTGSGKTLAAFLVGIDRLFREAERWEALDDDPTRVVYVSPLKALAADIQQNLATPLGEIRAVARELGLPAPDLRVLLRTGDTPSAARAAMIKRPPHLLVTTPESLYLLVTAAKSRERLRQVGTVIVDEIHAVARDKRGAHLMLTLERLEALCATRPQRIGLSATQRPIETIADLLVGTSRANDERGPSCRIIDLGHRRALDLAIELPGSPLEAVISHEQWSEILDGIAAHVSRHRTTLIFVNTRRLAERLAHLLAERVGDDQVAAHHGSLSKERRLKLESRLRAGDLKVLVATASLELGIDIGPVELVCQIGSPRSLATFLQRVGRSGHARGATPKGRLYPTTRDELVECAAILRAVRAGKLDRVLPPRAPLDIVAQQIVAACAAEPWREDDLYALARRATPYANLSREDFDAVVEMLAEGIQTGRGRRGAYLHRDRVNGVLRGRRGARLVALTSGGAIPETADYKVIADPDDTVVGTVNEDWAIESMAGDTFLLGSTSWRIRRVEAGIVRVVDAQGAPPSVPFWLGEAPARTAELSAEVSELRARVAGYLDRGDSAGATTWLAGEAAIGPDVATQVVDYLGAAHRALGVLPTQRDLVFERFFDETGGMQLVIHAPFGGRINRALGLALRKRFCRRFDFELQAAANDDAIVLSLGPQQSIPLDEVPRFLSSATVEDTLAQALLVSPMFQVRWRWNLGRALMVLRQRGGRRNPPPIQRMEADDLMVAVFPALAACQENAAAGPVELPEHPMVRQTIHDCLHEATDVNGLVALLQGVESGAVRTHLLELTEPSPLSHEILNGRPFTFLDDAPLEERRTRAVALRRGLPESAKDLGRLEPDAIRRVREEARLDLRDAEELHDALLSLVILPPRPEWTPWFDALVRDGRAARATIDGRSLWLAAESLPMVEALFPRASIAPRVTLPEPLASRPRPDAEASAVAAVRGHISTVGPCTVSEVAALTTLPARAVEGALARLESEGFILRGRFDPERTASAETEFCERRLLARIHRYTTERLRQEIEPVTAQDFVRFLLRWQHVTPGTSREGRRGLLAVVEQLQGFELAAGSWEDAVFPARVANYRPEWLDDLCLSGEVVWARLGLRQPAGTPGSDGARPETDAGRGGAVPSRATPVSFALRDNLPWLLAAARGNARPVLPGPGAAHDLLDVLRTRGALFYRELVAGTGRLRVEVEEGLWDLVSRGLVTADGFGSVRALLTARERWAKRAARLTKQRKLRHQAGEGIAVEGRWSLLPAGEARDGAGERADVETLAEAVGEQILARYGVVFRDLMARESFVLPWREILWALRRLEARGTVRGGRFVSGFVGEQFALPEAVELLRQTRRRERTGEIVRVAAVDPLNLVGVVTPGPRVPAQRGNLVVYGDGLPVGERATVVTERVYVRGEEQTPRAWRDQEWAR
ncbi:MAG TPA: DEAD/DEAH box helicase [Candidatus Methylomirabilis sp.]|nr:DEAD/DEAH box helicase [Candidatus Methylomirabilis sp.]